MPGDRTDTQIVKTIQIPKGGVINWSVSADGYTTQTGSTTVNEDTIMDVNLSNETVGYLTVKVLNAGCNN